MFQRMIEAGFKLKLCNCKLLQPQMRYLGHIISKDGVATEPEKVEAVKKCLFR